MLKKRLIAVLLLQGDHVVRSEEFRLHQCLGAPLSQAERYAGWDLDELVYLDITPIRDRSDAARRWPVLERLIPRLSGLCRMPLTFGGGIRTLEDIRRRLALGADKVTLNTQALAEPGFITAAAREFGSQAITVSLDVRRHPDGRTEVFSHGGRTATGWDAVACARSMAEAGAGEIFLNSIDRDGTAAGYDLALVEAVVAAVGIPVVACGGARDAADFVRVCRDAGASAAAAAHCFLFTELSYPLAKRQLVDAGVDVRPGRLYGPPADRAAGCQGRGV